MPAPPTELAIRILLPLRSLVTFSSIVSTLGRSPAREISVGALRCALVPVHSADASVGIGQASDPRATTLPGLPLTTAPLAGPLPVVSNGSRKSDRKVHNYSLPSHLRRPAPYTRPPPSSQEQESRFREPPMWAAAALSWSSAVSIYPGGWAPRPSCTTQRTEPLKE